MLRQRREEPERMDEDSEIGPAADEHNVEAEQDDEPTGEDEPPHVATPDGTNVSG
jgi:hypothetical protein